MRKTILIAGTGFAGMWAALSAARAVSLAGQESAVDILVVSPSPTLVVRPRLYEPVLENIAPDLTAVFQAANVRHIRGMVEEIRPQAHDITLRDAQGTRTLAFDKFILATGSQLHRPAVPGLADHAFNVDTLPAAQVLGAHLNALPNAAETKARNTVVVVGGGLTGIETAAEMPNRLRQILGKEANIRVLLLDQAATVAPDLGAAAQSVIQEALIDCNVTIKTGTSVAAIDAQGVTTTDGTRIETRTVIWTGGTRANALTSQLRGERDSHNRLVVDPYLRAPQHADLFVTGDSAFAASDALGNHALMSCQHALSLGRVAGHNAAAELVGLPLHPYSQPKYVTCLDLGPWGALYTEGWDRQICLVRDEAKALKRDITTKWIYPPEADRSAIFAVAAPDHVIVP